MSAAQEFEVEPFAQRQTRYKACLDEIKALGGWDAKSFVVDKPTLTRLYSRDKSSHISATPAAAVQPNSIEKLAAVVKICAKHKMPMTPRGAGTGIEGGAIPYGGGLVIGTDRLKRLEVDPENACVWAGSGVTKMELNKAVQKHGLLFGPDPSSNPNVGGMVATSGSGMCTMRYGTTRENVLSLRVVTPKGDIVQTRQVVRKSSAGLELTQLYIGSEGTLGIIAEVCFKLFPNQKFNAGAVANFKTTDAAVKAVVTLQQQGVPKTLLRCELMNKEGMAAANAYSGTALPVMATVLLEFTTNDPKKKDLHRDYKTVEKAFRSCGAENMRYLKDGKSLDSAWLARRACLFAAMHCEKAKGLQKVITTDVCVPLTALAKCIEETEKDFAAAKKLCFVCAHIADSNFHVLIPYTGAEDFKRSRELESNMVKRAVAMGGTVSGEHGIGIGKVHHVVNEHGQSHIDVQESIKKALDPDNLMNPGCFYPFEQKLYPTSHL